MERSSRTVQCQAGLVQPFLALYFRGKPPETEWLIDVGGEIDSYIEGHTSVRRYLESLSDLDDRKNLLFAPSNWLCQATPRLQYLLQVLAGHSLVCDGARGYTGSRRATHVLRDDLLYERFVAARDHGSSQPRSSSANFWPPINAYLPEEAFRRSAKLA